MAKHELWHPPLYDKADAQAIQHLALYAEGKESQPPSAETVRRALDWIINQAASTYEEPFRPGAPDIIAYMLGRRSVGLAIVKLMKLKIGKVFHGGSQDDYSEHG
jgi:hypothetical protein